MAKQTPPMPDWWPRRMLDEVEVSELLKISVPTLQTWRCTKTRDLPYGKCGALVRYNPSDVWRWLCANTIRPVACA